MPLFEKIIIGDVEPFSIVDFPNHIAAVAFLQGCPWRCPFCYNKSLQTTDTTPDTDWTIEKFLAFLHKRKHALDAVVFSGGEPLMHSGLKDVMQTVRAMGYTIGLHTGGFAPRRLADVIDLIDWVGLDIKAPLEPTRYQRATGVFSHTDRILQSLDLLIKSCSDFECRTTCDPRILSIEDIYTIGQTLKDIGVTNYHLQKYRPVPDDQTTTDAECCALIEDKNLLAFLKGMFTTFDVRR